MGKKILLTIASIIAIVFFFTLPIYNDWLNSVIWRYITNLPDQLQLMTLEQRNVNQYSNMYHIEAITKDFLEKNAKTQPLILLPPTQYMRAHGMDLMMHDPSVFYYFTGIRSVLVSSSNVASANWVLMFVNRQLTVVPIKSPRQLADVLAMFKPYVQVS